MVFKLFLLLAVFVFSCGVKGNPKPPPSFVPAEVEDIHVKQYDDSPLIYFSYEKKYRDGNPINENVNFVFYRNEKKINPILYSKDNLYWFFDTFEDKENCYKVVVKTKKKESLPSKVVCIKKIEVPKVVLNPPKIEIVEDGLKINFYVENQVNLYRVYNQDEFLPIPYVSSKNFYVDKDVELDKKYCYYYTVSITKFSETQKSPTVCEVFKDIFPPLPPEKGRIIVDKNEATIVWEESKSKDVVGYLIYKNDKPLNSVPIKTYYFIDKDYKPSDVYKVVAVDKGSNKSKELVIKNE
ncbi:hypothetical protein [Sulfurihydrogenibium sp.]|uniref:hypothetical protein n=1 Tax=Sulfurihydrogenibium sp. TaxID=2053621 RepID=UPI0026186ACB|nr:hypothetical protein [Sulfurihydrogenibium sp.]